MLHAPPFKGVRSDQPPYLWVRLARCRLIIAGPTVQRFYSFLSKSLFRDRDRWGLDKAVPKAAPFLGWSKMTGRPPVLSNIFVRKSFPSLDLNPLIFEHVEILTLFKSIFAHKKDVLNFEEMFLISEMPDLENRCLNYSKTLEFIRCLRCVWAALLRCRECRDIMNMRGFPRASLFVRSLFARVCMRLMHDIVKAAGP